jgi:MarR family transcriptional regulator, organic hydroperoxide resistance regulator
MYSGLNVRLMSRPRSVQEEIQQRRPFSSPAEEAVVALVRTADLLRRALTHLVEPHGITLQQYNVLRILRGAAAEGLPTLEIAGRMIEQAPGVTRLLDRLQAKTLVRRQRSADDRRQIRCWITPAGLALLDRLESAMQDGGRAFMAPLSAADVTTFVRLLDALRAGTSPAPRPSTDVLPGTGQAPAPLTRR